MNQYIKILLNRFLKNLKHNWLLGIICVVASLVFVLVSFFAGEDIEMEESVKDTLVGVHSIHQLEWQFETKEYSDGNGMMFQTEVTNAKESLQFLVTMSSSGNFWNTVGQKLQDAGFEGLKEDDYFSVKGTSYNIFEIIVCGYDTKQVEATEQIIRAELENVMKKFYDVTAMTVVSEPVILHASIEDGNYVLSHDIYQENVDDNEIEVKNNDIFSFSNIVIVLSSLALWGVIVLLLTIADNKVYTAKDLENIDLFVWGEIQKDAESNKEVFSVISRKLDNDNIKTINLILLNATNNSSDEEIEKGLKDKFKGEVKVINWNKDAADQVKQGETVLLVLRRGESTSEEIERCTRMLQAVKTECIGCVLY